MTKVWRGIVVTARSWPVRRWAVAAALIVPLALLYASAGPPARVWWSGPGALLCAVLAATILASYLPVPGSGRLLDVGCSPCAAVAAVAVLGSLMMRATAPADPGIALLAGLILVFGLVQRLGGPASCPAPTR